MNAVQKFRYKRIKRLENRFGSYHGAFRLDADEDTEGNNGGRKSGGGHGNTRIPFGLCQREGIKVDPNWTPKDAWDALAGHGYSAGDVYKELKKTGTIGKRSGPSVGKTKRPPTKITESGFPPEMTSKAYRKNTMAAVEYINTHCDDGDVTDFLASATGVGAKTPPAFGCRRDSDGNGCQLSTSYNTTTGNITRMQVVVPMFSSYKDDNERAAAIASFAHEWTHYLDRCAREEDGLGCFSEKHKELSEALAKETTVSIGDEVKGMFDDFNKKFEEEQKKYVSEMTRVWKSVVDSRYGSDRPRWIRGDGTVDVYKAWYYRAEKEAREYQKAVRKEESRVKAAWNRKKRAIIPGVTELQGIYDSIYEGKLRAQKIVKFGHEEAYFRKSKEGRSMEVLADYVALKATNPKLAQVFAADKPEIAAALDACIVDMTKRLREAR